MVPTTLVCLPELRHRVDLLADMLDQNGIPANVTTKPTLQISDPTLIVVNAETLQTPWVQAIFDCDVRIAALLFERVAAPRGCSHIVDLCAWPARSADRNIIDLISWLNRNPTVSTPATPEISVDSNGHHGRASGGKSLGNFVTGAVVIALISILMWAADSGQIKSEKNSGEEISGVPDSIGYADGTLVQNDSRIRSPGVSEIPRGVYAQPVALRPIDESDSVEFTASLGNDSISRFCRARDLASASAWMGTFTWKQREGLENVPCVRNLLNNPEFEVLQSRV